LIFISISLYFARHYTILAKLTITPVLLNIFKFGKYKDRFIEDIAREDLKYIEWMRKNLEFDEDMRYTLDYYLH
jgi:hypothetical protein